ncbi:PsbP-related protein [Methanobacterium oryzae]|uniref:PsbP-related protein n=1 Tax=Methanobacterium oryzae TaxID=69540 RepID=UPI003D1C87F0
MEAKNKKYLIIIAFLVVGMTGISYYLILGNSSENEHFEGSNVSFDYPKGWSFGGYTDDVVVAQKNNPMASLSMRLHFKTPGTLEASRQSAIYQASRMNATILIDKSITVDGEKANYIAFRTIDGFENGYIIFFKNGKEYDFVFAAKNITAIESDIDIIVNSFHIKKENGFWEELIAFLGIKN